MASKILWICTAVMALLGFLASTGAEQAVSNLSSWVKLVGIEPMPSWLASKSADNWGLSIALSGLLICLGTLGIRHIIATRTQDGKNITELFWPKAPWYKRLFGRFADSKYKRSALTIGLKIEYKYEEVPHEGFFNWYTEQLNEPSIQRYRIKIINLTSNPIENVEVKLETIEEIEIDEVGDIRPIGLPLKQVEYPLTFEKSGTHSIRIMAHDSEWVPVVSYKQRTFGWVSIEGIDKGGTGVNTEGKIMSPHKPHRIKLVARGNGVKEDTAYFFVKLETIGSSQQLIMKKL